MRRWIGCGRLPPPPAPLPQGEGEKAPVLPRLLWREGGWSGTRGSACAGRGGHAGGAARRHRGVRRVRLAQHRQQSGVRRGRSGGDLLLIGEPPAADDDRSGSAFAGRGGRLSGPDARRDRAGARQAHAGAADPLAAARRPAAQSGRAGRLSAVPASADRSASRRAGCC